MKTQLRIMAILMGALVSGAAISVTTPTINVNPGSNAGTQGTGGQVIFNGSITDSSCNIDSASTSQTVDLGKWASTYFTSTGFETTKTPFHIKVKDCPASVTNVAVLFDGARDQSDNTLLATTGGAAGVAIKLYEDDKSTAVSLGKVSKAKNVVAGATAGTGTADLEFFADYISTGAVTAGDANGTANFNMIYN
ncbi:TPA: type 1 fimbrial protein [Klebsiella quasipneumoniae subsp. quasipneumoniae]|uniref:Fimbrial protein n=1 Tax=Klebsiella quasipneumoniae subsp. quasipneumoniae TaxID=1667327 RepID=A0AAN2CCX9_9ENTR|nr:MULTISPECIES: fimbrial protein [Klebsiella]EIV2089948.1 type 1 fimbrial protein [Klebsiella pneumoniae subsp. ozaenae]AOA94314.1 fimbrial protein [Klebsiella pneumoniae]AWD00845.1 type 1 fimbrial protein [Klebsiella pneumoniae]AWD98561.1 type 1 fimbrial protein [Klebsiella pneumoniae]AWS85738.1 type 1 fimbrial protein [Klebsiella pneumoniae]